MTVTALIATATGANEVVAIDMDTLQVTARVPTGAYPDGMAYAPEARKLYVSDKNGGTATVIEVSSNRPVASIPLGGEVGNVQYDSGSKHIFVNEQTHSELVEVDPERDRVIARIPLPGAKGNHGLLIDATQTLAFIACEDNDRLVVLDLQARLVKVMFGTGKSPDVLAYDDGRGLLYVLARRASCPCTASGTTRCPKSVTALSVRMHMSWQSTPIRISRIFRC